MPKYRFTALDAHGNRLDDELEALGPDEAAAYLQSVGLTVQSLVPVEDSAGQGDAAEVMLEAAAIDEAAPQTSALEPQRENGLLARRLTRQEVAEFTHHVSALNQAGLPLAGGLHALSEELAPGALRNVVARVSQRLEAGDTLEDAVQAQGKHFPAHLRGLVLAGVRSGRLGEVLDQFTHYYYVGVELKRRLWMSLLYPFLLVAVMLALFVFVSMVVVKQFVSIYADFGIDLPAVTRLVISMANVFSDAGTALLVGLLLGMGAIWVVGMSIGGASWRRSLTCRIPLIGSLWRWTALVEFTHLLGLLLESNVPLPVALDLTGEGLRDADIAAACKSIRHDVESGRRLADGIARIPQFPFGLPRILRWAESHQSLPGALHLAGDMYEARAIAQARFVSVACTALAIVFVFWGLSVVVVGLFLPLIQLISKLSG